MEPFSHVSREMDSTADSDIKEEFLKNADMHTETGEDILVSDDKLILAEKEVAKEEPQSEAEDGSDREIKYVNTQDFFDIGETVIHKPINARTSHTSPGITVIKTTKIAKKKNTGRRKERKPCKCNVCKIMHSKEKYLKCEECDYRSKIPYSLKKHAQIHTAEKPYRCEVCDYRCKKSHQLKAHALLHTEEKPYRCEVCDYRCKRPGHLKVHAMLHTEEKPYRCAVCGYQCRTPGYLTRHIKIHTDEKPYKCEVCDYQCRSKSYLKAHAKSHTADKPYRCEVCDYRCKRSYHLKVHAMLHTEETPYVKVVASGVEAQAI